MFSCLFKEFAAGVPQLVEAIQTPMKDFKGDKFPFHQVTSLLEYQKSCCY